MSVTVHTIYDDRVAHEAADDFDITDTGGLYVHAANKTIAVYAPGSWASAVIDGQTDRAPLA